MAGNSEHRKLLDRIELAVRTESAEARASEWREATDEARSVALVSLCIFAYEAALTTGYEKPPLKLVRLPRRSA
jgi:hypothetical protein